MTYGPYRVQCSHRHTCHPKSPEIEVGNGSGRNKDGGSIDGEDQVDLSQPTQTCTPDDISLVRAPGLRTLSLNSNST